MGPSPLAFIWRDGEMIDINPDFGTAKSEANGINSAGVVTGWMGSSTLTDARAFIWDDGKVTELPPIPEGLTSDGFALNDQLDVVGRGRFFDPDLDAFVWRAFVYVDGKAFHLDPLPGTSHSSARDINNAQTVVGSSNSRAFIWQDGSLTDLNDLVPSNFNLTFTSARSINETGQIAARANGDNGVVGVLLAPILGLLGDLDGDCIVGVSDLLILLAEWGQRDSPADLNGDGVVGVADLLILLMNWG